MAFGILVASMTMAAPGALTDPRPIIGDLYALPGCSYEAGGTDLAIVQFAGGDLSVGGCAFETWSSWDPPELAFASITDNTFNPVGGVICTDVDFDFICGDPAKGETSVPFCGAVMDVYIGFAPVVAVFVDGPAANLAHCGIFGQGTNGFVYVDVYADDPPPPPPPACDNTKTVHLRLETVGAGWSTSVETSLEFDYPCSDGPHVFGNGLSCGAIYHTIADCDGGTNSFGGTVYGDFVCSLSGCAADHLLQGWIWVSNDGSFSCDDYVSTAPPSLSVHCHQH